MTGGPDVNAPWNVGANGPDPAWMQEQEGSAWNGFYSVVTRKSKRHATKPMMRSMTCSTPQPPPGLSSLSAKSQRQKRPEVNIHNAFKALSVKGDEEQEEERPGSSTSRSCSNDCGCERLPQNARITIIKKSELTEIKASAKAKKKQRMKEEKGARRNREKDDEAAMKNEQMEEYEGKRSSVSTSASTSQEDFEEVITGDEKTDSPVHPSTTYSTHVTEDRI